MSLTICPECGHEVSNEAVACPNCGRPLNAPQPAVQRRVIVAAEPDSAREGFPKWLLIPIVVLGVVIIFLFIALTRNNEEAETANTNVNLSVRRQPVSTKEEARSENPPNQVEVPSSSSTVNPPPSTTAVPQNVPPSSQPEVRNLPADRGLVMIDAKVSTKNGQIRTVKNEKFYLLDKDLEEILSDADLEPLEGQTLSNSFGLAVLYPARYGDFQRDALNAIKKHIKYDTLTDSNGQAALKDVKPDSYYLFGITKTRNGFAIWSSPVSIIGGENKLNLQPAPLNELSE